MGKQLTYDNLKTEKFFKLYHNNKFYHCELITNGKKNYKSTISPCNLIPTNQLVFKEMDVFIKYQYAIEYRTKNNKVIHVKSWCYIPYSFIDSFDLSSFYTIYNQMEYYLENYLKNKCNYIKEVKEL